jgi:hypothetical protein
MVVDLSYTTERNGVWGLIMIHPSHFREVFVNDIVVSWTPSQDKWPSTRSLKHEINKEWQEDGLGKSASQTKVPHTLYKGTHK